MIQWTETARQTFDRFGVRARQSLVGSGADADEVIDDLRRHVEEEARSAKLSIVTEEDMQRILGRVGEPANLGESQPRRETPLPSNPDKQSGKLRPGWMLLFIGVILPVITIGFELVTGISASVLFDPFPTWFHVIAVAFVPAVNFWMWRAGRAKQSQYAKLFGWLNGAALGVCVYYSALYLPFSPFAAIGVIYIGLGLIPLTPFFALIATSMIRSVYRERAGTKSLPGLKCGFLTGIVLLIILQLPTAFTYYGLARAASDDPATSRSGVRILRAVGDRELMLRACYGMLRREVDMDLVYEIASGGCRVPEEAARLVFYRVTGQPFNATPPPSLYTRAGRWTMLEDEFTWDDALGGEAVAGRVKGLSLQSSRLDAIVEPDAAIAYCEWTLEFRNVSTQQREARAQIALPPGGVVSRLTLWVNGEEREAAFAGRAQVREAYKKVAVVQRRDPVLVTTCGPDRILMQCFPVPANGGTMKVRVGITAPLALDSLERGRFAWPKFLERNFGFSSEFKHTLWIESPSQLAAHSAMLKTGHPKEQIFALHGSVSEKDFADGIGSVVINRSPEALSAWTPSLETNQIIRQTIRETTPAPPSRVVVVIDGSAGMKDYAAQIAEALARIPEGLEVAVLIAGDETVALDDKPQPATAKLREVIRRKVRSFDYIGGRDNLSALEQAWDLAAERDHSIVIWIHAAQPFLISSADALLQRLERSAQSVRLIGLQVNSGPNRIAEKLDGLAQLDFAPRFGTVESDLTRLLSGSSGQAKRFELERERIPNPTDAISTKPASRHLERLWAHDETARLTAGRKRDEATQLAAKNQLVTPVTGAVVLETQLQFAENNLKPADPATVPAIPEPQTWTLLILGFLLLWLRKLSAARRMRKSR